MPPPSSPTAALTVSLSPTVTAPAASGNSTTNGSTIVLPIQRVLLTVRINTVATLFVTVNTTGAVYAFPFPPAEQTLDIAVASSRRRRQRGLQTSTDDPVGLIFSLGNFSSPPTLEITQVVARIDAPTPPTQVRTTRHSRGPLPQTNHVSFYPFKAAC